MHKNIRVMMLSALATLNGCASTTPIAVPTPQWEVPPVDPVVAQAEASALIQTGNALTDWRAWLSSLPRLIAPPAPP